MSVIELDHMRSKTLTKKWKRFGAFDWCPEFRLTGGINLEEKIKDLFSEVIPARWNP